MATLEYTTSMENNREASKILLEFDDELNIHEFKTICIRMASAMGYNKTSITSAFGNEYNGDFNKEYLDIMNIMLGK